MYNNHHITVECAHGCMDRLESPARTKADPKLRGVQSAFLVRLEASESRPGRGRRDLRVVLPLPFTGNHFERPFHR